ncbi:MAG: DUF883 domain-containing protein [Burkholderiaceae bacterium]
MTDPATGVAAESAAEFELHRVITSAEQALDADASTSLEAAAALRRRALAQLESLHERLTLAQDVALETSRRAGRMTDQYVHDNPWRAIAAAAAAGLLLGLFLHRRSAG